VKFSSVVSGAIRGKKNSANGAITCHLTRAFERGARRLHWVITGLKRAICEVTFDMEDSIVHVNLHVQKLKAPAED